MFQYLLTLTEEVIPVPVELLFLISLDLLLLSQCLGIYLFFLPLLCIEPIFAIVAVLTNETILCFETVILHEDADECGHLNLYIFRKSIDECRSLSRDLKVKSH